MTNEGVALNKGNIHIAKTSPPDVHKEYYKQFEMDFNVFLRSRACEVVHGGRMVLTFQGRIQSNDTNSILEPLRSVLHDMVLEVMQPIILIVIYMVCKQSDLNRIHLDSDSFLSLESIFIYNLDSLSSEKLNLKCI